jgi:hypothetical protein
VHGGDPQAEAGEQLLRIGSVVFEPVAERAAADDLVSFAPEAILKRPQAFGNGFEDDDPVATDPAQLGPQSSVLGTSPDMVPRASSSSTNTFTSWPSARSRM